MKVIQPSYKIEYPSIDEIKKYPTIIESYGRVCYKSENKQTNDSSEKFVSNIISRGHLSVIEHLSITVRFIHNRGFTHELVRHRLASYSQESSRYCNYSQDKFGNELTFIEPYWWGDNKGRLEDCYYGNYIRRIWIETMSLIERSYMDMTESKLPPEASRGILPNDIKTEIVITANLREWIHIFNLRCGTAAHPDMRRVIIPLRKELNLYLPMIFTI